MSNLPAPLQAGGTVMAIVPASMEDAYRLAKAVCAARMAPKGLDTPESCMIAIMHGLEVGLKPLTALQRIAVVNGRPTIWGDGAMSLVRGSGACDWVKETIAGEGDKMVATCSAQRRGEPEPVVRTFSVAEAKQAGLWGKSGPWQQFPKRMLAMRARAFCLRDGFADVLGGLYLKEEVDDERPQPPRPTMVVQARAPEAVQIAGPSEVVGLGEPAPDEPVTWDEETGEIASAQTAAPARDAASLIMEGNTAADFGTAALQAFWGRLTPAEKREAGGAEQIARWKQIATARDAESEEQAA